MPITPHDHSAPLDTTLDFVNTLELCSERGHAEYGGVHETFQQSRDAAAWLLERQLVHAIDDLPAADDAALARIRAVRAAFRELVDAAVEGRRPDDAAVETMNGLLATPQVPALEPTPTGVRLTHRHLAPLLDEALARLAEPLVETLVAGDVDRLRVCANDLCRYAFFDSSRSGRRRWCDMQSCGNRAKAARHRARTRTGNGATANSASA